MQASRTFARNWMREKRWRRLPSGEFVAYYKRKLETLKMTACPKNLLTVYFYNEYHNKE